MIKGIFTLKGNAVRGAIVSFVAEYTATHPYCPSMQEISDAIGCTKSILSNYYLPGLRKSGRIDWLDDHHGKMTPRTIHVPRGGGDA